MMPELNKFSSSDSENELLLKKRRNSGRQSIRVAQTNWLKEFSGLNLAQQTKNVITNVTEKRRPTSASPMLVV